MKGETATRALLEGGRCTLSISREYGGMSGEKCSLGHVDGDGHVPRTVSGDVIQGDLLAEKLGTAVGARVPWDRVLPPVPQSSGIWTFKSFD